MLSFCKLQIHNVQIPYEANEFVQASVFVIGKRKNTSLLQNLSIFGKLRIRNVL